MITFIFICALVSIVEAQRGSALRGDIIQTLSKINGLLDKELDLMQHTDVDHRFSTNPAKPNYMDEMDDLNHWIYPKWIKPDDEDTMVYICGERGEGLRRASLGRAREGINKVDQGDLWARGV